MRTRQRHWQKNLCLRRTCVHMRIRAHTATCAHEAKSAILQAKAISIAIRLPTAAGVPNALGGDSEPLRHIVLNVTICLSLLTQGGHASAALTCARRARSG